MNLSLAANFDRELLERLRGYPVREIYGRFHGDRVGGGRAGFMRWRPCKPAVSSGTWPPCIGPASLSTISSTRPA